MQCRACQTACAGSHSIWWPGHSGSDNLTKLAAASAMQGLPDNMRDGLQQDSRDATMQPHMLLEHVLPVQCRAYQAACAA